MIEIFDYDDIRIPVLGIEATVRIKGGVTTEGQIYESITFAIESIYRKDGITYISGSNFIVQLQEENLSV